MSQSPSTYDWAQISYEPLLQGVSQYSELKYHSSSLRSTLVVSSSVHYCRDHLYSLKSYSLPSACNRYITHKYNDRMYKKIIYQHNKFITVYVSISAGVKVGFFKMFLNKWVLELADSQPK